ELELATQEKFGVDAPRFAPLRDGIQELRQMVAQFLAEKLAVDPDPIEPEPEVEVFAEESGAAAGGAGATAMPAAIQSRADADARIAAVARYLRSTAPTDPASYLMLRG